MPKMSIKHYFTVILYMKNTVFWSCKKTLRKHFQPWLGSEHNAWVQPEPLKYHSQQHFLSGYCQQNNRNRKKYLF